MIGGIIGAIIGIVFSIYFAAQDLCVGLYANPDGTFNSVCPKVNVFGNLQKNLSQELMFIAILIVIGVLIGLIYSKFKNRKIKNICRE